MASNSPWRIPALLALATAIGCGSGRPDENVAAAPGVFAGDYPLGAVATVGMVADLVRHVGGEPVDVVQMMGSGVDPHLYKATRDDLRRIVAADAVFYSGLMLEGKMIDALVKVARTKPVYSVTERLDESLLLEPAEFAGHYDPHVWMDVSLWSRCAGVVADALAEFDPPHADDYQARATEYGEELARLDAYGREVLGSIPSSGRVLVTSHDAFNYFGRAYGLDVQGVQGISTESEAGLQRINELVDRLVDQQVRAVFVESSVPRKNIEALVEGVRARGGEITVGGELFSDAMGATGTYEGTYVGMLDHNFTTVARALGGSAPEGGMQGKLAGE